MSSVTIRMELSFSHKGLLTFDAAKLRTGIEETCSSSQRSALDQRSEVLESSSMLASLPIVRRLDLSYNSLHLFTGGETLKGLTVLNLAHNSLTQLLAHALPPTLQTLDVSHNDLAELAMLATYTPHLKELDAGHNALTTSSLRNLPDSIIALSLDSNDVESLSMLEPLSRLTRLSVAQNRIAQREDLKGLQNLSSLRNLNLRGNPVCLNLEAALPSLLGRLVPRLSHFNGDPLSQAPENRLCKVARQSSRSTGARKDSTAQRTVRITKNENQRSISLLHTSGKSTSCDPDGSNALALPLEITLMQSKVSELRRLLSAAQDAEEKARQERLLLIENVKSTAKVIDSQASELDKMQKDIEMLQEESQNLETPIATVEETFERTHASLQACKAKASGLVDD